ncbi:MAG: hypothetical protein RJA98_3014 [Pseudomonadota bacterium]
MAELHKIASEWGMSITRVRNTKEKSQINQQLTQPRKFRQELGYSLQVPPRNGLLKVGFWYKICEVAPSNGLLTVRNWRTSHEHPKTKAPPRWDCGGAFLLDAVSTTGEMLLKTRSSRSRQRNRRTKEVETLCLKPGRGLTVSRDGSPFEARKLGPEQQDKRSVVVRLAPVEDFGRRGEAQPRRRAHGSHVFTRAPSGTACGQRRRVALATPLSMATGREPDGDRQPLSRGSLAASAGARATCYAPRADGHT